MTKDEGLPQSRQQYTPPPARDGEWVPDDEWMSWKDAARALGVHRPRAALIANNGHLTVTKRRNGDPGVTCESVKREARWRAETGLARRIRRGLGDFFQWF